MSGPHVMKSYLNITFVLACEMATFIKTCTKFCDKASTPFDILTSSPWCNQLRTSDRPNQIWFCRQPLKSKNPFSQLILYRGRIWNAKIDQARNLYYVSFRYPIVIVNEFQICKLIAIHDPVNTLWTYRTHAWRLTC